MHKHKVGIIGVVFLQIIALVILTVPEIYATEETENVEKLTCKDLAQKFGIRLEKNSSSGDFTLVKGTPRCSDYAENHDSDTYKIIKINGVGIEDGELLGGTNGKKAIQFQAGWQISGNKYYVTVELENTNPEAKDLEYQYIEVRHTDIVEEKGSSSVKTIANDRYNEPTCKNFRSEAGTTTSDKYKFYSGSVPECFKEKVVKITTLTKVKEKINNTKELWDIYKKGGTTPADFETIKNKAKIENPTTKKNNVIEDPTKQTICLNCNYKFVNTGNGEIVNYSNYYGDTIKSAEYYLNKDYYYSEGKTKTDSIDYTYNYAIGDTEVVSHTSCKRKCEESVQVEYGPPVASKAGLCFEYKVKVTSYVKCSAEFVAPDPSYTSPACTPAPRCESVDGEERDKPQAGPTEEFELCIKKCDGGKYTEKCSISCYKQAYGNVSTKLAVNYEDIVATKLAESSSKYTAEECLKENEDYYGCYERTTSVINWYALDNYKTNGKIDTSKQTVLYNNKNSLGRWYLDRAYSEHGSDYDAGGYDISGIKTCTDKTYCGKYIADSDGFYRANYSSGLCDDICEWQQTCEKDKYLNPGTIAADEERNRAIYDAAKTACIASNTCETHQATFSISINYDKEDKDGNTTITRIDFPFSSKTDSIREGDAASNLPKTMAGLTPGNESGSHDSIILDKDGCYKSKEVANKYMAEWSFPGTYIHNKTGEISFEEKKDDGWYYDDQKFCMPLDAESVNAKWWEWYKLGNKCYTAAQIEDELKGKTGTSNGYNIVARTRNFGKFKWNFDIKCFYALRNEICNVKENGCCGPNKKENNGVMNYTFRTIDKNNMFPNAKEPGVIDPTKREIGFNWTDKAKSSKNPNYEIDPKALIEHIESNSATLYDQNREATNLDYRFYLTPADLAKIRAYNDNNAYASWKGDVDKKNPINGVYVYQSNLFRETKDGGRVLSGESILKLGDLGKNNQGNQPKGAE